MSALADWAESGALLLTGRSDGPPLVPPGSAATWVCEQLDLLGLAIPGLLGERAAYAGLARDGPWSCGGAFRVLPTRDGHLGLSLARPEDTDLVPALVQGSVQDSVEDSWAAVSAWARRTKTQTAADRVALLGLPGGAVPTARPGPPVRSSSIGERRHRRETPLVVDLSGLWAGPLCANLLGLTGARVVKVESSARPDGARRGPADFFTLLHRGHAMVSLDLPHEMPILHHLVAEADLVIESSRPRALRNLGLLAEEVVAGGTSWLSITARGRSDDAVGFGDDVAAAAGLVVDDDRDVMPVGDAIADPLTGVAAAVAAREALRSAESRLIEVSMLGVAAALVGPPAQGRLVCEDGTWFAEDDAGRHVVRAPRRRRECC